MADKPILFSGPMVRAILAKRKRHTRRIVTRNNSTVLGTTSKQYWDELVWNGTEYMDNSEFMAGVPNCQYLHVPAMCEGESVWYRVRPRIVPGDSLWVRESWQRYVARDATCIVVYRADGQARAQYSDHGGDGDPVRVGEVVTDHDLPMCWRPSIHMPKWACRLRLKVTGVRVERVQEITRGDAMTEGCPFPNMAKGPDPREWFANLWDEINGKGSWDADPWVWVYEFEREKQ